MDRIEIRDGKTFKVTVLPEGATLDGVLCFACKTRKPKAEIAKSGRTRKGKRWSLCQACNRHWAQTQEAKRNGQRLPLQGGDPVPDWWDRYEQPDDDLDQQWMEAAREE